MPPALRLQETPKLFTAFRRWCAIHRVHEGISASLGDPIFARHFPLTKMDQENQTIESLTRILRHQINWPIWSCQYLIWSSRWLGDMYLASNPPSNQPSNVQGWASWHVLRNVWVLLQDSSPYPNLRFGSGEHVISHLYSACKNAWHVGPKAICWCFRR